MSFFKKLQEKRNEERIRKSERMQGFTMQAELSGTIVCVKLLEGGSEKTKFLVEYADGSKKRGRSGKQQCPFCGVGAVPWIKKRKIQKVILSFYKDRMAFFIHKNFTKKFC